MQRFADTKLGRTDKMGFENINNVRRTVCYRILESGSIEMVCRHCAILNDE